MQFRHDMRVMHIRMYAVVEEMACKAVGIAM
jgi:hypothetical protein